LPIPGPEEVWDGLIGWFRRMTAKHVELLDDRHIGAWNDALRKVALQHEGRADTPRLGVPVQVLCCIPPHNPALNIRFRETPPAATGRLPL